MSNPDQCPFCRSDDFHLVKSRITSGNFPVMYSLYKCDRNGCLRVWETKEESTLLGKPVSEQWRGKSIE